RRAMGKKKPEEMAKVRQQFIEGGLAAGVEQSVCDSIFDDMEKFSGYAFNKSHSATYAIVSFQTAWLKRHYPAQFMAATLSADMQHTDKVVTLVDEVRRMGLQLDPPNVNRSEFRFTGADNRVIYGLGAVRGVGAGPVQALVESRQRDGDFRDLADFCLRVDSRKANRRTLEALIRSGAMDDFRQEAESIDGVRARLMAELGDALQSAEQVSQNSAAGMVDLFGGVADGQAVRARIVRPLEKRERLEGERESLGLYLTGHPIEEYLDEIRHFCNCSISRLKAGRSQLIAGLVVSFRTMRSRRGGSMGFAVVDDRSGRIEASIFADVFEANAQKIRKDAVLVLEGEVQEDDFTHSFKLKTENVYTIEEARRRFSLGLEIDLAASGVNGDLVERLRTSLEPYRHAASGCSVAVVCSALGEAGNAARGRIQLGPDWRVNPSDELLKSLRNEFGSERVSLNYRSA
ncbi:MAG: DNA polymerase III subunit alpha, partial [Pseudomonadales bacterium]|nr:DNA polymerase III subunit alpha [Pseudomonadales bacterium]